MGRSVSVPVNAICTAYIHQEFEDEWDFTDFREDVQNVIQQKYPSFDPVDRWVDREECAILENGHGQIVIAEYCGLVSISLTPLKWTTYGTDHRENIGRAWCDQIANNLITLINETFGGLRKVAVASNGEAFFESV